MIATYDDAAIFGLVDIASYPTFVAENWTLELLTAHFAANPGSIAVFTGGQGGFGTIDVELHLGVTDVTGFREFNAPITVTAGSLHIASYTALTMAAQFEEQVLPGFREGKAVFEVPNGSYVARVIQTVDPTDRDAVMTLDETHPLFIIELEPGTTEPVVPIVWL
jgi:hypothetical protein